MMEPCKKNTEKYGKNKKRKKDEVYSNVEQIQKILDRKDHKKTSF